MAPVYISLDTTGVPLGAGEALEKLVAEVMKAHENGSHIYIVHPSAGSDVGRAELTLDLKTAGLPGQVANSLGWATSNPNLVAAPDPSVDTAPASADIESVAEPGPSSSEPEADVPKRRRKGSKQSGKS